MAILGVLGVPGAVKVLGYPDVMRATEVLEVLGTRTE